MMSNDLLRVFTLCDFVFSLWIQGPWLFSVAFWEFPRIQSGTTRSVFLPPSPTLNSNKLHKPSAEKKSFDIKGWYLLWKVVTFREKRVLLWRNEEFVACVITGTNTASGRGAGLCGPL